ncbi:FG-GAP-like repeat-containing protein [Streptomyces sp. NPDC000594]|uniref:FG-GAP-like repeat-containing protein n=1 Tax=Streptomyces sp. NPDC000594 TaxID=3154261 RepID=UPI003322BD4A
MTNRLARGPVLAAAAMAVAALTAPLAIAAPVEAPKKKSTAAQQHDFNGDGVRDLAVAVPGGAAGAVQKAGAVSVLYGSKTQPVNTKRQVVHQDTAGVPGTAAAGDRFGSVVASGDLDRDGYADLVVSAARDTLAADRRNAGSLTVFWGGAQGLSGGATLAEGGRDHAQLGDALTVGDFDGDGDQDVAVSVNEGAVRVLSGPFGRDGSATSSTVLNEIGDPYRITDLAAGDVNGDGRSDLVAARYDSALYEYPETAVWTGTAQGLNTTPKLVKTADLNLQGGENLDVGDVNKDGFADIVVGRYDFREYDIEGGKGGRIIFYPGSASGPVGSKAFALTQDSPGVPGTADFGDNFGSGVSVADVNGDGYADVSAGIPGKKVGPDAGSGAVMVLRGAAKGPVAAGATVFHQDTTGVPGDAEAKDEFGFATALTDLNGDNRPELAVGGPGENNRAGSVWLLQGGTAGPSATGSLVLGHGGVGTDAFPGSELGNGFGNASSYRR